MKGVIYQVTIGTDYVPFIVYEFEKDQLVIVYQGSYPRVNGFIVDTLVINRSAKSIVGTCIQTEICVRLKSTRKIFH